MLVADAVMGAGQPRLQVGKDQMNDRQILFRYFGVAPLSNGEVSIAVLTKVGVAGPIIGGDRRARDHGALDEAAERLRAAIGHDGEADAARVTASLALIELGTGWRWRTSTALATTTLSVTPRPLPRVRPPI